MSKKNNNSEEFDQNDSVLFGQNLAKSEEIIPEEKKEEIITEEPKVKPEVKDVIVSKRDLVEIFVIKDLATNFFIKIAEVNVIKTSITNCDKFDTYEQALETIKENIDILSYVSIIKTYK